MILPTMYTRSEPPRVCALCMGFHKTTSSSHTSLLPSLLFYVWLGVVLNSQSYVLFFSRLTRSFGMEASWAALTSGVASHKVFDHVDAHFYTSNFWIQTTDSVLILLSLSLAIDSHVNEHSFVQRSMGRQPIPMVPP